MKKLISLIIASAMLLAMVTVPAFAATDGSLGENVTYHYDTATTVLTVSGSGPMTDYASVRVCPIWSDTTIRNNVTEIVIEDGITHVGNYCFSNLAKVTTVTIPESVTSIGDYGFNAESMLTSCDLPSGLTSIGASAFNNCKKMTSLTIPQGVTSIGASAFNGWELVTELEIPGSVQTIGNFAFKNWNALTSLTLNEGLVSLGEATFSQAQITEVQLPATLQTMRYDSFSCYQLEAYTVAEGSTHFAAEDGVLYTYGYEELVVCPHAKEGVVTINPACTAIGSNAFYECFGITGIVLPDNLTSIGDSAFNYTSITEMTVPATVTSMGLSPFEYCNELVTVNYLANVAALPNYCFAYCYNLQTVTLGPGVHAYGVSCFTDCTSLVNAPVIEDATEIPEYCFYNCSSLASFPIPATVTSIGPSAFENCTQLAEVTLPEGLVSLGTSAFKYCSSIETVVVPEGVTMLPYGLFQFCTSLREVEIMGDLANSTEKTVIGSVAFGGCTALEKITFHCECIDTKKVNSGAFNNAADAVEIHYPAQYPEWAEVKPMDVGGKQYIYVADAPDPMPGDINLDGIITSADISSLFAFIMNEGSVSAYGLANADINGDGVINTTDVSLLAQMVFGM